MLSAVTKSEVQTVLEYEEINHLLFRCVKGSKKKPVIEQGRLYTYRPTGKSAGWVNYPVADNLQEELFFARLSRAKQCKKNAPKYYDPEVNDDFRTERVKLPDTNSKEDNREQP